LVMGSDGWNGFMIYAAALSSIACSVFY
jgi:hypothetical protein